MRAVTPNRRKLVGVEVADVEKRRVPSKHYSYVIKVTWSDESETVVYRRYSKFFEFQIILLETFPWEGGLKEPSARIIPFLPGKILFRRSHVRDVAVKRLRPIDDYCKALVKLPTHISHCDHVLDFFETRQEDLNPIREESRRRRKDEQEIGEISGPLLLESYVAIADYTSTQQKELSITVGQRVEVIEKNENGWWFASNDEGERGWLPGVYLERPDGTVEDLVTKRAEPGQGERYVTTDSYAAQNADDISFGAGVVVEVLQKNLEGWWLVSYNGKQGLAPASYLEKSHNWVQGNTNKVEIISSIRDLKEHRLSLPASSLSSIAFPSQRILRMSSRSSMSDSEDSKTSAEGPVSPSYTKEKTVQPPPKRSSVKRTSKKRPDAPPPLPPSMVGEPTYDYMTIAQFDADIPDGVSFDEEKKVQVLEKSPGGWWFVMIDGQEGWAPASYIEKRETTKLKSSVPSQSNPLKLQKNLPNLMTNKPGFPAFRKVPSVPNTATNHRIEEAVASLPTSLSQCSMSLATRPLPPLPTAESDLGPTHEDVDTYEEVGAKEPVKENLSFKRNFSASSVRNFSRPGVVDASGSADVGPVDFRSVLKSNIAAKHSELKSKPGLGESTRPDSGVSKPLNDSKPRPLNNGIKPRPNPINAPQKTPGFKKTVAGPKVSNPPERPQNYRKPVASKSSDDTVSTVSSQRPPKAADNAPMLPPKPKPTLPSAKAKPVLHSALSSSDGAVTDFRNVVLKSASRRPSEKLNGVGRARSFNTDKGLSKASPKEQPSKPPSLPKKPFNVPLKPTSSQKLKRFDDATVGGGEEGSARTGAGRKPAARPPWNSGSALSKPVLRRLQMNNNSNVELSDKKPVFTVGHARIELKNQPDFSSTLIAKRGSPDGQVDSVFDDASKEAIIPVSPPVRKKKAAKTVQKNIASKTSEKLDSTTVHESGDKTSNFLVAIANYTGVESSEISFSSGDKAEVLDQSENDWWYVKIGDSAGWAPSSFFRLANALNAPEKEGYVAAGIADFDTTVQYDGVYSEIELDDLQQRRLPMRCVAVADFEASQSSMVNLHVGDEVTVTQEADGGWWYAVLSDGGGDGWVPSNFLNPA